MLFIFTKVCLSAVITDPIKLYQLGNTSFESGDYKKAIALYEKAKKSDLKQSYLNKINSKVCSAFFLEIKKGNMETAKMLINNNIFVLEVSENQKSDIIMTYSKVIEKRDISFLKLLIEKRFDVNVQTKAYMNFTPLLTAVASNNVKALKLLVKNGADVNQPAMATIYSNKQKELSKMFPIVVAALNKDDVMVNVLIKAGANIHSKNSNGEDALRVAMNRYNFGTAKSLLKSGADPNSKDNNGISTFCWFVKKFEKELSANGFIELKEAHQLLKAKGAKTTICHEG